MRKIWLLAIAVALLTTACRIETNVLVNLNDDGTGSFGIEFGMDDEFRQLIAAQGEGFDTADLFGELGADMPGATTSERTEGDMMYSIVTVDFASEEEFKQLMADGAGEGGDIDVTWTDDSVSISATLEGTGEGGLGGLGDLGDAAGDLGGDFGGDFEFGSGLEGFADNFFSGSVIVSMPGSVSSHNADRQLADGRLVWDLTLDGSNIDVVAVSDLGGGTGFPAWAILLLALIAVGVLLWLFSAQRKRTAAAAIAAAAAGDEGLASTPPADWSTPARAPEEEDAPTDDDEDAGT
jgi:hypothetical protein